MANINQGTRSGNAFGRVSNTDFSTYDTDKVALKPGYLIRLRNKFHLVEAAEALSVDLFFTDTVNAGFTITSGVATANSGTHINALARYDLTSIAAYYGVTATSAAADRYGNILKTDFDSGFLEFGDLEPFKGNLYQLCPTLPNQPKFMTADGKWQSLTALGATTFSSTAASSFQPVGFPAAQLLAADNNQALDLLDIGDTTDTVASNENGFSGSVTPTQIGTVSAKLYIKHPAGVPKNVLDEAAESESGPTPHSSSASGSIEGLSGFVDGQMSPLEAPMWDRSIFIEHGENNLPRFRLVNDSNEFLMDGRVRLVGWKYRIIELNDDQMQMFRQKSGGRLTFKIINTAGLPTAGSMLADYFPK